MFQRNKYKTLPVVMYTRYTLTIKAPKVNEYDQETTPQSDTADQPMAPRGKLTCFTIWKRDK